MDRVLASGARGHKFESCIARQKFQGLIDLFDKSFFVFIAVFYLRSQMAKPSEGRSLGF
ncbi:protein of unknown function [Pseudodesulfovibrio profundus]|uniref:Uncharacterized protein n=1 Tax=Pseudodesulfovibrio profundus TaxID=57320 RepID=A0A2C8F6A9_9BACT|nr:protein of unknown function [Pseudodesulfovibrio profundus]